MACFDRIIDDPAILGMVRDYVAETFEPPCTVGRSIEIIGDILRAEFEAQACRSDEWP